MFGVHSYSFLLLCTIHLILNCLLHACSNGSCIYLIRIDTHFQKHGLELHNFKIVVIFKSIIQNTRFKHDWDLNHRFDTLVKTWHRAYYNEPTSHSYGNLVETLTIARITYVSFLNLDSSCKPRMGPEHMSWISSLNLTLEKLESRLEDWILIWILHMEHQT